MAIQAIVFDFGGVVIRTPFEMVPGLERRLGLPPGSIDLAGPFDPEADPLWRRFRAGEFTELEYWHRQADRHAEMIGAGEDRLRSLMDSLFDAPKDKVLRPDTWQLRRTLIDRGLRVAALTNDLSRFHDPAWIERMDVLDRFDPFVDLSNTGILKPDPRGYRRVLDGLGVEAGQVLFVDDQPVNITGAESVGMRAVHFNVLDPTRSVASVLDAIGNSDTEA
ncbi:MAG: HAD-IA family hydrolase [bacterium]|nr:HAD-IA family hydrolase [bacterium]